VDDVSLEIERGETLGLVGESGCGKSTLGRVMLRLIDPTEGQILFEGRDIAKLPERELRPLRRRMQIVFQDPYSSPQPAHDGARHAGRGAAHPRLVKNRSEEEARVASLLERVGLRPEHMRRYPTSSAAGSGSASASRGRWPSSPASSWPTSPSARSTCPSRRRS
jgi:ABC-type oligopeptide transport system ATPase subunit